jgi:hypothetical protein
MSSTGKFVASVFDGVELQALGSREWGRVEGRSQARAGCAVAQRDW